MSKTFGRGKPFAEGKDIKTVQFVGDFFVMQTPVTDTEGMDDEEIIAFATRSIHNMYGWDIAHLSNEINILDD